MQILHLYYTVKCLQGFTLLYGEMLAEGYLWAGLINSSVAHAGRGMLRPNRQTLYRYSRSLFRSTGLTLVIVPTLPTDEGRILLLTISTKSPSLYLLSFIVVGVLDGCSDLRILYS